jgi:hypothetical protein
MLFGADLVSQSHPFPMTDTKLDSKAKSETKARRSVDASLKVLFDW